MTNISLAFGSSSPRKKPRQLAGGCGCLFFSIFFFAGLGFLAVMIGVIVLPEWRANHSYVAHTCVVLDKRVGESRGEGTTYRPEIYIQYTVQGNEFRIWTYDASGVYSSGRSGKQEIIDQFIVGRQYPCWYDPDHPSKAVLVLGYSWFAYLFLLLPLLFMAIGAGGMCYFWTRRGKSAEELAAAPRSRTLDQIGDRVDATAYPTVPDKDLSGSPGTTLKYRLPLSVAPGCMLVGAIGVAVFWNGITAVFVTSAVQGHLQGRPDWFLTVFILPFVAIGLIMIGWCIRQFFITIGFSTAEVEIDSFPLVAGQNTRVQVSQPGPLRLKSLGVLLVCEESASYTQGTNTRTETKRVYQHTLAQETDVLVTRDMPWQFQGKIEVPHGAMHSFEATHNKIVWKLVVQGKVRLWPNFAWEYPLVVRPAPTGGMT